MQTCAAKVRPNHLPTHFHGGGGAVLTSSLQRPAGRGGGRSLYRQRNGGSQSLSSVGWEPRASLRRPSGCGLGCDRRVQAPAAAVVGTPSPWDPRVAHTGRPDRPISPASPLGPVGPASPGSPFGPLGP